MKPPVRRKTSRKRQQGQATIEFVVLSLALVPLLLVVSLLGKYLDLMQTVEQASRYAAFQGIARNTSSTWHDTATLASQVRRRFFSDSTAPIKTGDIAGDFPAHRNPLWSDPAGRPLIERFGHQVSVDASATSRHVLTAAFASALDLPRSNLYTAAVTVKPGNVSGLPPFDAIDLSIQRRTVLLVDPWTARGPSDVRTRIEDAPVLYPFGAFEEVVRVAGMLPPLVFDPSFRAGDFDWDVVPCDRLKEGC